MKRLLLLGLVATALLEGAYAQEPEDKWDAARKQIRRLSPTAFSQLPRGIAHDLRSRGCQIPQTFASTKPHNIIRGQFVKGGQNDWAVLCSIREVSAILIFWNGSGEHVSEIAKQPDKDWLQGTGNDQIGYSRQITAVGKKYIMEHYKAFQKPRLFYIDHEGIDDAFLEKASVVHYYHRGKWLVLPGAD